MLTINSLKDELQWRIFQMSFNTGITCSIWQQHRLLWLLWSCNLGNPIKSRLYSYNPINLILWKVHHLALVWQNDNLHNNDKPVGFLYYTSIIYSDNIFPTTYVYLIGLMLVFMSLVLSGMTTHNEVASFCS